MQNNKKEVIYDFTLEELKNKISPSFRAKQIYNWLYKKYTLEFNKMSNLPKTLIEDLEKDYITQIATIKSSETSKDGSIKYLFEFADGHSIESVFLLMKDKQYDVDGTIIKGEKYTFCISTQVGCKVGCSFCLTAKGGFVRNLSAAEIVYQVLMLKKLNNIEENKAVNIVYMGMGEPLDNFDNLIKAIKIISELDGLAISTRRQTISTSGISSKIDRLGKEDLGVQLAISLHAVDDELRSELIPMNKAYNIESIINAVRNFPVDTRKKVMFEYLVIKDKNDDLQSAKKLVKLLDGIKAKVNLIYFNPYPNSPYQRPSKENMVKFQDYLISKGVLCTIRESKGLDISAACGQLKEKDKNGN
ncbi:MAG: 23S rRNA (adenine(2503)-C(2))-methyltransferase RlmN [Arcobacter butzleri]|jgi:23S rRNA (adenine2503-C2)-methyltransferase|nr:23S rRNA (adenine(2503)-C(2))-methyltransferase RlmN [Arcobacteraceae bacterium]MDY0365232.1 23S rRNA (adenine(2503)-C(2))-methyltransferase RlmN [Arcobacteraceae bacterium]NLO17649.1 23S rRNA (adenine(2503)-C(2))-methyltransferase RlmN [Aliarcobacter butzleri]